MFIDLADKSNWVKDTFKNLSIQKLTAIIRLREKPILIGGCGRSGTSLLLSILSAHPNIYGICEETNIFGYKRKFDSPVLNRINNLRKLMPHLLKDQKILFANRWCEKTPRNIRYVSRIAEELLGNFQFIHIVRDGRDVVTSIHPQANEYHVSIERWVSDVTMGLENNIHPNTYLVRYEDIVSDFGNSIKKLLDFLGEDYVQAVNEFHIHSNVRTHGAFAEGVVKNIYPNSIGKWKNEVHKVRIKEFYNNYEAMALLKRLGYEI